MARVTVEDCIEKVPNRFALVILVAKRAKQLLKGASPTVESKNKYIVSTLREVALGHISFKKNALLAQAEIEKELISRQTK